MSHTFVVVGNAIQRSCIALCGRRQLTFYCDNTIVTLALAVRQFDWKNLDEN